MLAADVIGCIERHADVEAPGVNRAGVYGRDHEAEAVAVAQHGEGRPGCRRPGRLRHRAGLQHGEAEAADELVQRAYSVLLSTCEQTSYQAKVAIHGQARLSWLDGS